MKQNYLKNIALTLLMTSLSLTLPNAMEKMKNSTYVDELQEYTLINAIKGKPLQDALTFLTEYCVQNFDASENLYQESILYDARRNPDIKNQDRLFVLDFVFKEKEMTYEAEFKILKLPEPEVLKQRCLSYYPYALCLSLASFLKHEKAKDRLRKINKLMGMGGGKYAVWSPDYLENIEVNSYNNKEYISRSGGENYKESVYILGAATNLSVYEWNKSIQLKNGKQQKAIYEYYFQPDTMKSFRVCSMSDRQEMYFYFPPHLKKIFKAYNSISDIREYSDDASFETDPFHSLIVDHMEKTVSFCESIAKTDKYDLILEVLQTSHKNDNCQMEGLLKAIENAKEMVDYERKNKSSKIDLTVEATVLDEYTKIYDEYAKTYKAVETSYAKYLILKEEALKKEDKTIKMEDFKPLILSSTSAAKVAKSSDLKAQYCDLAIKIIKQFLNRFKDAIRNYSCKPKRTDDIECWAEHLWRQASKIAEETGKTSCEPEVKAEYYEKAIKYYKKDKSINFFSFSDKKLAELYKNVGTATVDIQKKINNLTQSIKHYETFCKDYDRKIDEKLKDRWFHVNRCDIEEIAVVIKDSAAAYEELAQFIGDPIKQQEYLEKAKRASEDGNYDRQNTLVKENEALHVGMKKKMEEEEKETKRCKEEAEKRRQQEKQDRWK